ncbi:MAG: hypothetical protein NC122_00620 [Faecalibacterium sp.]|nr:hypothetical protein [Ruminococcus sp.]MCM1484691.1 hypothetical protein [Faecalibacterium sp.]
MSTYSDTLYSNTTIANLLSLRQEEQLNTKYIGFRSSNTEYVLVISKDFTVNGSKVTAKDCDVIVYDSNMGTSNATRYFSVSYPTLTITVNHVVTSNFLEGSSKNETSSYQRYVLIGLFCVLAVVIFWVLRRFK